MKVLFIDFDGVLHPSPEIFGKPLNTLALQGGQALRDTGLFRWAGLLEDALLGSSKDIAIVVHSSWRDQSWVTDELMRQLLGPLDHRFAGCVQQSTPREAAIELFIDRLDIDDFLILDDARAEFDRLIAHLVTTNPLTGISDPDAIASIQQWAHCECRDRRPIDTGRISLRKTAAVASRW